MEDTRQHYSSDGRPMLQEQRNTSDVTTPARDRGAKWSLRMLSIPSTRLVFAYILDWVVIVALAAAGVVINQVVSPYHRPFSLLDLNISFPVRDEKVTVAEVGVIGLVVPAVVVALIALLFVPGPRAMRTLGRTKIIRTKLWELEKGLAGLALSCAAAFFITMGTKNLFGKPRPNALARCVPDLSQVSDRTLGGFGQDLNAYWTLVDWRICTNPDRSAVDDAFRSFPSGHSSFAWSGLLYLTLFIMSKFSISFPHLPFQSTRDVSTTQQQTQQAQQLTAEDVHGHLPLHNRNEDYGLRASDETHSNKAINGPLGSTAADAPHPQHHPYHIRHLAASPPNHLLLIAFLPVGVAIWISSTRYVDFYHFGFDIFSGSLIGIFTSWFSFRWYHLPLSRGQGWAWGARSKDRAFGIGVGTSGWVGEEGWNRRQGLNSTRNV